ncbi:MAG: adenylate kinase [Pseudomonadota bacterium]
MADSGSPPPALAAPALGQRVHVWGNSSSGKSTLAAQLGEALQVPVVELDALNWLPNWVGLNATDPDRLRCRIREATAGDCWIVAGSYTDYCQQTFWPRLETLIWLDLPRHLLLRRMLVRSWRRYRSGELLWGTNRESFWGHFAVWNREQSLLWWIWTQHARKRRSLLRVMSDPSWAHIRVIRLTSAAEVEAFRDATLRTTASGASQPR